MEKRKSISPLARSPEGLGARDGGGGGGRGGGGGGGGVVFCEDCGVAVMFLAFVWRCC